MYRFLVTPKWLLGHVLLLVMVTTFVTAGFWQLRRLDEVRARRILAEQRVDAAAVPLEDLLADTGGDPDELAYRRVRVTGEYLAGQQVATVPRSRRGRPGNLLLTPLEPEGDAPPVLVERGWVPFAREGVPTEQAAPPTGEVVVEGVLLPGEGDGSRSVFNDAGLVTLIDATAIRDDLGLHLQPLALRLLDQEPAQRDGLPVAGTVPTFDEGNHLSYAAQWFLFAAVSVVGYPVLVVRTARDRAAPPEGRPRPERQVPT